MITINTEMLGGWKFANIKDGVFAEYFHVNDAGANLAPIPKRIELAKHFGADAVVDFSKQDAVEAIQKITGQTGVDGAIEALGSQKTFEDCIKVTRPGGTVSNIGYHGKIDFIKIPRMAWGVGMSDITIRSGLCPGGRERLQRLLRIIANGRVDPTPLTSHTFHFDELQRAFHLIILPSRPQNAGPVGIECAGKTLQLYLGDTQEFEL